MTPMRMSPLRVIESDHQAPVAAVEEVQEFLDLRKALQLPLGALAGLRKVQIGVEEQPIGALELPLDVIRHTVALQSHLVQTIEANWIAICLHVRRHILGDSRAATREAVTADLHELVRSRLTRHDRLLVDGN